mgnify:CR=1 FL=1
MSDSDSESSSYSSSYGELSENEISEIFSICRRNHIKSYEKRILLMYPNLINPAGENILHNYIKNKGNDTYLMEKMIKAGMDLDNHNSKNLSPLDSLLKSKKSDYLKTDKVIWLLLHDCPHNHNSETGVQKILVNMLKNKKSMTKKTFKNIKKLVDKGYFKGITDLTDQQLYFPELFCTTVSMLEWFDTNFKINWKFTMPFMNSENRIHTVLMSGRECEKECLDWLIQKNTNLIGKSENAKLLKKIIDDNNITPLKKLYNQILNVYPDSIDAMEEKTIWSNFQTSFMSLNKHTYFSYFHNKRSQKIVFIYGLLHNKIQIPIHLGLIRKLNLCLEDVKNMCVSNSSDTMRDPLVLNANKYKNSSFYSSYLYHGMQTKPESGIFMKDVEKFCSKHNNLDLLCMFPEDIPDKPNELLCFPDGTTSHVIPMTKKECLNEQDKISLFLQNHFSSGSESNSKPELDSPTKKKIKTEIQTQKSLDHYL